MLLHHVLVRCGRVSAGGSGTYRRRPNFANLITLWWRGACEESQLRF